jgi:hypothetical protein
LVASTLFEFDSRYSLERAQLTASGDTSTEAIASRRFYACVEEFIATSWRDEHFRTTGNVPRIARLRVPACAPSRQGSGHCKMPAPSALNGTS